MVMLILEYGGLHLLHWLISGLVPLLLLAMALIYFVMIRHALSQIRKALTLLETDLPQLEGRKIEHLPLIIKAVNKTELPLLRKRFQEMEEDSKGLYESRWLPDPDQYLQLEQILTATQASSLSWRPAGRVLAVGVLASLLSLLLQQQYPPAADLPILGLTLAPFLTALALCFILAGEAQFGRKKMHHFYVDLKRILYKHLPVFADQAGISLLVDQFMKYDRQMNESLASFNRTAQKLADSEMAEGIRRSVEHVLLDSVAPSIQEAAAVLKNLASELTGRQEQGMQELASTFASALSADLAAHLRPVNKEISQMTSLMADVKNYIEYAMRALETVRTESAGLLNDTSQAIIQMAESRSHLNEDLALFGQQLAQLTAATSHMAELQQGNENGLSNSINQLSSQLERYGHDLKEMVDQAEMALEQAKETAAGQTSSADLHIASIEAQVQKLSESLSSNISQLLENVGQETRTVARHSAEIGASLSSLNETLSRSLNDFSQESAQYVQNTLSEFDQNLAELVRRLSQATVEIRDAVDALPAALQQRPKFE